MSAKSTAQHPIHTQGIFNRKFGIFAVVVIGIVFVLTILKYPLIFGPEKTAEPIMPATQIK